MDKQRTWTFSGGAISSREAVASDSLPARPSLSRSQPHTLGREDEKACTLNVVQLEFHFGMKL